MIRTLILCGLLLALSGSSIGQQGSFGQQRVFGQRVFGQQDVFGQRGFRGNTAPIHVDRRGVPDWGLDDEFPEDVFTFVRLRYNARGGWGKWATDYPDSDLNYSFRLNQLTSLKTTPDPVVLDILDPALFDYPFLYIIEPGGYDGGLNLSPDEVSVLRRYLDNGGFIMVDDFWGEREWDIFYREIKKVLPDSEPVELPLEHPIFHCVYELEKKPQVPAINVYLHGRTTYERSDAQEPHYRAFYDENERLQMIVCHNTDLGDGWEREGENETYFREMSEKWAYPLGINILFYSMTH